MSIIQFTIETTTRDLYNETPTVRFVEHDRTIDIVRFMLPSGFAEFPMDEQTAVRVMYIRPGATRVRAVTIPEAAYEGADEGYLYYDWRLSDADLASHGTLKFAICIIRINSDGSEEFYDFNSCITDIQIASTLHADEEAEEDPQEAATNAERIAVLESVVAKLRAEIESLAKGE